MLGSSQLDLVIGLDMHMEMVPMPGPVPMPFPMPFVGMIELKPVDLLIQLGMAKAMSWAFSTPPTGPVFINGFHATKTGDEGKNAKVLPHMVISPGTMWTPMPKPLTPTPKPPPPPPDNPAAPAGDAIFITGSKTVYFEGNNGCRLGTVAMSCGEPVRLPSSTLIAIPKGMPVLVGGPDAFDWSAAAKAFFLRNKWTAGLLQELVSMLNPGRLRNLLGWAACFLTGHPIDVATGRLLTRAEDFTIRGPIPITFERYYASSWAGRDSSLGFGWSHTFDERIWGERGKVIYKAGDGREIEFHTHRLPDRRMREGDEIFYPVDKLTLRCLGGGRWTIQGKDGLRREFALLPGDARQSYLATIRNRVGQWVRLDYDDHRCLDRVETSEGRWARFEHRDGLLRRIAVPNPDGEGWYDQVRFEYSPKRDLVRAIDSQQHARVYRYEAHLLIEETDRDGVYFCFEYDGRDASASCVRTWGNDGKGEDRLFFREITYDKAGGKTFVEDSLGHTTTYVMNEANAVVTVYDPKGAATAYEYNDHLWKIAETDALGHQTRFEYDARGNETKRTLPNGGAYAMEYNAEDLPVRFVDPNGAETAWGYDAWGRQLFRRTPSETRWFEYTGVLLSRIRTGDRVFSFEHTAQAQIAAITFPDGTREERWYDNQGRMTKTRDAAGRARRVYYDWESRVAQVEAPGGIVKQATYSPEGDVLSHRDALRIVQYTYCNYHKVASREEGGTRIEYRYTPEGALIAMINEANESHRLTRDACGYIVSETGFDGRRTRYERNLRGDVTKLSRPSQTAVTFEYNALGLPTSATYPDGTKDEYTYDLRGDVVSGKNESGTVQVARDAAGREVAESFEGDWVAGVYDASGNRSEITSSLGFRERIERSSMNDVASLGVFDDRGRGPAWKIGFERDVLGNELQRLMPGGVSAASSWDVAGSPVRQTVQSRGAPIESREYAWESGQRLAAMRRGTTGETRFRHDERSRLAAATGPTGQTIWRAPDRAGHLFKTPTRRDRRYGGGGVLLEADGTRYAYDADGNQVLKVAPNGDTWTFTWNGAGLLARVKLPDGAEVSYAYDAFRRRVLKTAGGKTTRWLWDGNVPLHEVESEGDETNTTTWIFEPRSFAPIGKIAPDGKKYSIVTDYLGTPTEMFDEAGTLAWKAQLDVYGVAHVEEGKAEDCPWRWPGQYEDAETGLYYNRFRSYDPERGGYISKDPMGIAGGARLYGYTPDPLSWIDPFGLNCQIGAKGEAQAKQFLQDNGYTEIMALQNPSGHGIDLVAKDTNGLWTFFEVKASDGSRVPGLSDAQEDAANFIKTRLQQAAEAQGAWTSTDPAVTAAANRIIADIGDTTPNAYAIGVSNVSSANPTTRASPWR